jgi:hypothetical protein
MRRRTPEQRYHFRRRKQQQKLEEFTAHETDWARDLMLWYKLKKLEMPDDEYRGCAFFLNKEYQKKPGSLTLLYSVYIRCYTELPEGTKENRFDLLRFRYRMYAITLTKGGF